MHVDHGYHGYFLQGSFGSLTSPPLAAKRDKRIDRSMGPADRVADCPDHLEWQQGALQNALHDPSHSSANRLLPQAQGPR
jgi:hypothetical protein